jgi:hypothetical protein
MIILFTHEINKVFHITCHFLDFIYQDVLDTFFILSFFLRTVIYKQWTTKKI